MAYFTAAMAREHAASLKRYNEAVGGGKGDHTEYSLSIDLDMGF